MQHKQKNSCAALHAWVRRLPRHRFDFAPKDLPANGIYFLFEEGEAGHGGERVVRVGTHTGAGQLPSRLYQHFLLPNKDRSIFRKNIGRALLAKAKDPYAAQWEHDLTSRAGRLAHSKGLDAAKQKQVEKVITKRLCKNFSFAVVPVKSQAQRLALESALISTVSHCADCKASAKWLGQHSPLAKIRQSGLWQVQRLYQTPLTDKEWVYLQNL